MSYYRSSIGWLLRSAVAIVFCSAIAAQEPSAKCRPDVIPVENEPPPKISVDAALAVPLARGVAVIQYYTKNLHIVPVFGAKALALTPRIGHLHVRVDDAPWVWAEASGNPIILLGLAPGPHKVTLELMNANHQPLDKAEVAFMIPKTPSAGIPPAKAPVPGVGSARAKSAVRTSRRAAPSHHPR